MKKNLLILFLISSFFIVGVTVIQQTAEQLPNKSGAALKFLQVNASETAVVWNTVTIPSTYNVIYIGTSAVSISDLLLTPDIASLSTLSATGSMKFNGEFSLVSDNNFASVEIKGLLVRNSTNGVRFIGVIPKIVWDDQENIMNITASYTPSGQLNFIASGTSNLSVFGNVFITKVLK